MLNISLCFYNASTNTNIHLCMQCTTPLRHIWGIWHSWVLANLVIIQEFDMVQKISFKNPWVFSGWFSNTHSGATDFCQFPFTFVMVGNTIIGVWWAYTLCHINVHKYIVSSVTEITILNFCIFEGALKM